ncbi:hypothetical protein ABXN37_02575 [Piscinibacter sakaiensis]
MRLLHAARRPARVIPLAAASPAWRSRPRASACRRAAAASPPR